MPRRYKIKWRAQGSDKATGQDKRHFMSVYYSMISWVDEQIGRVLDARAEAMLQAQYAGWTGMPTDDAKEH